MTNYSTINLGINVLVGCDVYSCIVAVFIIGLRLSTCEAHMSKKKELTTYHAKRDFAKTSEPSGLQSKHKKTKSPIFVVHEHHASHIHWDLRIEIGKTLVSWAVPKGPSMNTADKRLAVMTEDHPIEYASFEGVIPPGQYGAGPVMVWDAGTVIFRSDPKKALKSGRLEVELHGTKLRGGFALVRLRSGEKNWLFIKMRDEYASPSSNIVHEMNRSATTDRTIDQIEADRGTQS